MRTVRAMLTLAEVKPGDVVYDLGCGDGRVIVTAAREFGARAVGIELDPLRFLFCRARIGLMGLKGRVSVRLGDFFKQDLSGADVVTCYLLQETNKELAAKLRTELRPGTRIVSNTFTFADLEPEASVGKLHLYVVGASSGSP